MGAQCCAPTGAETETEVDDAKRDTSLQRLWQVRELQLATAAGVLLLVAWLTGLAGADTTELTLELGAAAVSGCAFIPSSIRNLFKYRHIGVGTLMTVAAIGAVALGQFFEAAMLGVLFSIAEGLEHYAVVRTRRGLRALLSLVPDSASVLRDGHELQLAPGELALGDVMLLRPGQRTATDGVIRSGRTSLDLSAITGESMPVEVAIGDPVHAGAINGGGAIEVEVTALTKDSSLARIVHIVEEAQERKGGGQRLADRLAKPLVPGIVVLAVLIAGLGAVFGDPLLWLERALVVLVAASPCALAIAVPLTVVAAVGAASRTGALVKGGLALEQLGAVRTVALDKTGTLTRNDPRVIATVPGPGATEAEVLRLAAALESRSEHPLAAAILAAAGSDVPDAADVTAVVGHGLRGEVDGARVRLGRPGFIDPGVLASDVARLQDQGATVVLVEHGTVLVGAIAVRDELRPEAAETVQELGRLGVRVAMLTGDNARTAQALATSAGISDVRADLRPEDKAAHITDLKSSGRGGVAMVGDGINDAPALATADVGIAMGAMGTDVAVETADAALMGEDLRHLPQLLRHTRRARRLMVQNIVMSLAIITVLIPLAAFGVLGLATVVFIHELAEVVVIANAIRGAKATPLPGVTAVTASASAASGVLPEQEDGGCCDSCLPQEATNAPEPIVVTPALAVPPTSPREEKAGGCCADCSTDVSAPRIKSATPLQITPRGTVLPLAAGSREHNYGRHDSS